MMRAIREDEDAAAAVGKNVCAKLQVLILGALLGGLALLPAWQIGIITPDDYQPTFTFYAYPILILECRPASGPSRLAPSSSATTRYPLPQLLSACCSIPGIVPTCA